MNAPKFKILFRPTPTLNSPQKPARVVMFENRVALFNTLELAQDAAALMQHTALDGQYVAVDAAYYVN